MMKSETIRHLLNELLEAMPITDIWAGDYVSDPRPYKLFEHCLINVISRVGRLLSKIEMADHYGVTYELAFAESAKQISDDLAYSFMSLLKASKSLNSDIDIADSIIRDLQRRGKLND